MQTDRDPLETLPLDAEKFARIRDEIRAQYTAKDGRPWIIGFSAGKDSTLLAQLVLEAIDDLPPSKRTRKVYIVCNDTLVESPIMAAFVRGVLQKLRDAVEPLRMPLEVITTTPDPWQTFWVNLIGRGYPAPSRAFRWCTDRMKIRPTGKVIAGLTAASDAGSVLLIGVRRDESETRAASIDKHHAGGTLMNPHSTVRNCMVYAPIKDLTTQEVWTYLLQRRPPWGGTHRALVTLYRGALGGECPFVVDTNDAPSCGDSPSARFGCWTCTVVEKDRSLEGMVDSGAEHLAPLIAFRDWLKDVSADHANRLGERRNGEKGLGPFSYETRESILNELLKTQAAVGVELISPQEVDTIRIIWGEDRSGQVIRRAETLLDIMQYDDADQLVQLRLSGAR